VVAATEVQKGFGVCAFEKVSEKVGAEVTASF
jgi:hypothetical protein